MLQSNDLKNGLIVETDLRGRKPKATSGKKPLVFYRLKSSDYNRHLQDAIRVKRDCSTFVLALSSYAGFYAQQLWVKAFRKLDFNILEEDAYEFEGKSSSVAGDIDIIVEKDGVVFGVEVKNGLSYPTDIRRKFRIAAELRTIPFFVARALSFGDRVWLPQNGGLMKIYEVSIFPSNCPKKVKECIDVLGYPILVREEIDEHVVAHLSEVAKMGILRAEEYKKRVKRYLKTI